jgi:C4-dicarboxylate-specific signal transduction histidine kinase
LHLRRLHKSKEEEMIMPVDVRMPQGEVSSVQQLEVENRRLRAQLALVRRRAEKGKARRRTLIRILRDVHTANIRLENSRKAMIHVMGDLRDTTEAVQRREEELRRKQGQLVQARKLSLLGELSTGIAHELNNPLNNVGLFIRNVLDRIEMDRMDTALMVKDLRNALQQVRKAAEIISRLRTFGRTAPAGTMPVSINEVIEQAVSLVQEQLKLGHIEIKLDLSPAMPVVRGNAIQLEQVFVNLLTNAGDALAAAPLKTIFVRSIVKGGRVQVVVQDTGPGIPAALQQRIFDPFFTTKPVGAGMGLGLSIIADIIKEHHGLIFVESSPGEGARFVIELRLELERRPASAPS